MLLKCYQRRLIPLTVVALGPEKELQYHGLAACIDSGDDCATLSKKLVNFFLVTPEKTGLNFVYLCMCIEENRANTCIRRAAIQKCHGILLH